MHISGLLKMTLLDYPGRVACTIFTKGCNFRCPFCHNASLVNTEGAEEELDTDEVLRYLKKRAGLLDGVVVSGGEPLLQADLEDFLVSVRSMGYEIKIDTNGSQPEKLIRLAEKGLIDYAAMDIKNSPALYDRTIGLPEADLETVRASRDYLLSGRVSSEFRTTVVKGLHTAESLTEAARFIEGAEAYYLQQYTDSGNILSPAGLAAYSDSEMRQLLACVQKVIPGAALRGLG